MIISKYKVILPAVVIEKEAGSGAKERLVMMMTSWFHSVHSLFFLPLRTLRGMHVTPALL